MTERTDGELIQTCLEGDAEAWETLVHRYERLIYSIPFKFGLRREDAMEIFQSVWLDCFKELDALRSVDRLQAWLVRITVRKCYRFRTARRERPEDIPMDQTMEVSEDPSQELVQRLYHEQMLRTGIARLTERCRQIIKALFFEDPFPGYAALAARLGLSANSIGFTRDRCLDRLGRLLEEQGYEN